MRGRTWGAPVAATDADTGDTLTYTLTGEGATVFEIVSTSGQIRTKAALDYETKSSYYRPPQCERTTAASSMAAARVST